MGRCSVLGCLMKTNKKHQNVTLHRLPTSIQKRKQWLDILQIENLNTTTKCIFICSLHFEEECFNRTLNVTRLRDDALPSSELLSLAQSNKSEEKQSVPCKIVEEEKPVCSTSNNADPLALFNECEEQKSVPRKVLEEKKPVCSISSYADLPNQFNECEEQQSVPCQEFEEEMPVCDISHDKALQIIQKLKSKCELQKKKIRRLNDKVRRQSNTIADLKNIMKYLKDKNYVSDDDHVTVLE